MIKMHSVKEFIKENFFYIYLILSMLIVYFLFQVLFSTACADSVKLCRIYERLQYQVILATPVLIFLIRELTYFQGQDRRKKFFYGLFSALFLVMLFFLIPYIYNNPLTPQNLIYLWSLCFIIGYCLLQMTYWTKKEFLRLSKVIFWLIATAFLFGSIGAWFTHKLPFPYVCGDISYMRGEYVHYDCFGSIPNCAESGYAESEQIVNTCIWKPTFWYPGNNFDH
jgi:uncharacterized membrane protein YfcA